MLTIKTSCSPSVISLYSVVYSHGILYVALYAAVLSIFLKLVSILLPLHNNCTYICPLDVKLNVENKYCT